MTNTKLNTKKLTNTKLTRVAQPPEVFLIQGVPGVPGDPGRSLRGPWGSLGVTRESQGDPKWTPMDQFFVTSWKCILKKKKLCRLVDAKMVPRWVFSKEFQQGWRQKTAPLFFRGDAFFEPISNQNLEVQGTVFASRKWTPN